MPTEASSGRVVAGARDARDHRGTAHRMNKVYRAAWLLFRAAFAVYFRWRVYHADRVPARGPVILASNHASYLDPPLIGTAAERSIHYLARKTLFRFPPIGRLLRHVNAVPVDRDGGSAAGVKTILDRLNEGAAIILFPEGTRSSDGKLQPGRSGIGLTVVKSGAPVVPVRIFGSFEAYGRNSRYPKPRLIVVKFGRPLHFEQLRAEARSCSKERLKQIYQQIADEVMRAIARLEPCRDKAEFP